MLASKNSKTSIVEYLKVILHQQKRIQKSTDTNSNITTHKQLKKERTFKTESKQFKWITAYCKKIWRNLIKFHQKK